MGGGPSKEELERQQAARIQQQQREKIEIERRNLAKIFIQTPEQSKNYKDNTHLSVVIGFSTSGKDTLIYNFDNSLLNEINEDGYPLIRFGNEEEKISSTHYNQIIQYENKEILNAIQKKSYKQYKQKLTLLNTVGFNDQKSQVNGKDTTITNNVKNILDTLQQNTVVIQGQIDVFYLVSALDQKDQVQQLLLIIKKIFGQNICPAIILVLTKQGLLKQEQIPFYLSQWEELAQQNGILNVLQFKGHYFQNGNIGLRRQYGSKEEIQQFQEELAQAVTSTIPYLIGEISNFNQVPRENINDRMITIAVKCMEKQGEEIKFTKKKYEIQAQAHLDEAIIQLNKMMNVIEMRQRIMKLKEMLEDSIQQENEKKKNSAE